ncbi:MAG: methyltransferase domain-containing protein [Planctomycetes bacterium]|nr:methyltransferase domain-containing protein [Planctomycetota bacterium]
MDTETIRQLIVPIEGYSDLRRRLLCGELERFRKSLEWIEPRPGKSLLDLGSRGDLVPVFRELLGFDRVVCVDAASGARRQTLVHDNGAVFEFEAHRINLETEPYPFPDQCFDQVVAMESIEHLAIDPMFMLAEANRVLKPRGALLLTTPNIASLSSLYRQLWGKHPAIGGQTFGPGTMDRHHREYVPDEVRRIMQAAGFEVDRLDTFDPQPLPKAVRKVKRLLRVLRWLKPDLDTDYRGRVIRCSCVKIGEVTERFPEAIYPRYDFYDYPAYDKELAARFDGRRYWRTNVVACRESSDRYTERHDPEPIGAPCRPRNAIPP